MAAVRPQSNVPVRWSFPEWPKHDRALEPAYRWRSRSSRPEPRPRTGSSEKIEHRGGAKRRTSTTEVHRPNAGDKVMNGRASINRGGTWGHAAAIPGPRYREAGPPRAIGNRRRKIVSPNPRQRIMMSRPAMTRGFRSSRRELQGKIASIFVIDAPQGRLRNAEEGFPQQFSSSRRGPRSFTPFRTHTHRRWGNIDSRGTAADRGPFREHRHHIVHIVASHAAPYLP